MTSPLQILLLEDDPNDAELVRELLADQFVAKITRAETPDEFVSALKSKRFDLILADYKLPLFDGLSALALALDLCPGLPFIFVSGTIGEDVAIEALKHGATDYVLKTRLSRLVPSVERALREAEQRAERDAAQAALRRSETYLAEAQRIAHVGWWERDLRTGRVQLSDESCRIFSVQPVNLPEWHERWLDVIHPEDRARAAEIAAAALVPGGPRYDIEYRIIRPDGSSRVVHSQGDVTRDDSGRPLRVFGVMQDITELRRTEQELRASEERFRTFVDNATDAFLLLDEDWKVLDVNRQACATLGYSREELIGRLKSGFDAELDEASIQRLKQRMLAKEAISFETRHRRKDGTSYPVEVRVGQFEQGGRRFLCLARDITERKQAEEELRASEERFRTLVQFSFDVYWETDAQHRFTRREYAEGLGEDQPAIGGRLWEGPYLEPDAEAWRKYREILDAHLPFRDFEVARAEPEGGKRYLSVSGLPVLDETGRFLGYRGVGRNITERKKAEEALRRSEAYLAEAQKLSHSGAFAYIAEKSLYWSEELFRIWGFDQLQGIPSHEACWERVHPDDRNRTREQLKEALREKRHYTSEFRIVLPDGTLKHLRSIGHPSYSVTGELVEVAGTTIDVTESKRAEETLRRNEAYLAEAQRLSSSGAYAFDANGTLYWSEGMYRIWGFDPAQGIPSRAWHRVHPDDRNRFNEQVPEALRERRDFSIEFRIVLPDGTLKYLQSIGHPSYSEAGEFIEVVGITMDVTDRKRTEQEHDRLRQLEADLAHLNRLSIMGELTASLAHEILHPIAAARNNARAGMRFLELRPPNLGEVMEALACVVRDADRAKDIVDRIRDHIKKAPPREELFDLNQAIDEVIVMVRHAIEKERVLVQTRLKEGMISVRGDRVQLQQVVLNLVLNGVEAMSSVPEGARELSVSTQLSQTSSVLVAVRDTGPGVNPEHLELVFNPFHTTKPSGIGMGLSICRSIIAAHGGRLWAEANQPRGATFQFTLPTGLEDS